MMPVLALLIGVAVVLVLLSFGDRLARAAGLSPGGTVERLSLALVLSLGTVTLVVFAMAWSHLLSRGTGLALMAVLAAVGFGSMREGVRSIRSTPWKELVWPSVPQDRLPALFCTAFIVTGLVMAMAPPTGMDTGVYHFTIPKLILQNGGLVSRDDVWIHKSGGFYMVTCLGMALGGEIPAKLLGFAAALAAVGLTASISERRRPGTAWTAAFLVLSTPFCAGQLGYEYLDLPVFAYAAASALALTRASEGSAWTVIACALAGFGLSTKSSAFATALLVPAALLDLFQRHGRRAFVPATAGLAAFVAAAGFWSAWNYASTGSLFFKYSNSVVDDRGIFLQTEPVWRSVLRALGELTTSGQYWIDSCGPFLLAALVGFVLFVRTPAHRRLLMLFAAGIAFYFVVVVTFSPSLLQAGFTVRYLAPILLVFGIPAAAAFAVWARDAGRPLHFAILAALFLPAAAVLALKTGKAAVAAPAALGLESRSSYLARKIETFEACERLNALPDPDVRVLFVAVRPYYLDRPYLWIPYADRSVFLKGVKTREDFLRRIREERITHVVWEPAPMRDPGFADPDALFGPPFREIGRWPWKGSETVRLYSVDRP
jgi:hypothetical protein